MGYLHPRSLYLVDRWEGVCPVLSETPLPTPRLATPLAPLGGAARPLHGLGGQEVSGWGTVPLSPDRAGRAFGSWPSL